NATTNKLTSCRGSYDAKAYAKDACVALVDASPTALDTSTTAYWKCNHIATPIAPPANTPSIVWRINEAHKLIPVPTPLLGEITRIQELLCRNNTASVKSKIVGGEGTIVNLCDKFKDTNNVPTNNEIFRCLAWGGTIELANVNTSVEPTTQNMPVCRMPAQNCSSIASVADLNSKNNCCPTGWKRFSDQGGNSNYWKKTATVSADSCDASGAGSCSSNGSHSYSWTNYITSIKSIEEALWNRNSYNCDTINDCQNINDVCRNSVHNSLPGIVSVIYGCVLEMAGVKIDCGCANSGGPSGRCLLCNKCEWDSCDSVTCLQKIGNKNLCPTITEVGCI
ncbi:MAG: hypothetical protein HQK51_06735, partial [Oligoflexia bacterium]|nr:hypothetical protein [Oligoflexia bacterium]